MGSGISAFSKLKWWQGMLSVAIGNLIACTILMLISLVFGNSVAVPAIQATAQEIIKRINLSKSKIYGTDGK